MNKSDIEQLLPITLNVEKGKTYVWCGCGKSKTQPFCDASQSECKHKSLTFTAELNESIAFCQCKRTKTPPFCDGSHASLLLEALKNRKK